MLHRPYPKIHAQHDGSSPAPGGTWVATEKVHGAQLVIGADGESVHIGKRKAWLEPTEPFFGWQLLRRDLEAAATAIRTSIAPRGVVRLYGEWFGGHYPHPDVSPVPGASAVQTGIWYASGLHFALFDVLVEEGPDDEGTFLAHSEVEELAEASGLLVVPLLGRGSRSTLEQLPVRFPTRVPARLGLPPLAGNVSEGMVLKPDARAAPSRRYVVKRKIPEFDEARFDESLPWDSTATLDVGALKSLASRLVNAPRLASARSKVGTTPDAIRDEVVLDVFVDLDAAFPTAFRRLSSDDEDHLRAHVAGLTEAMLAGSGCPVASPSVLDQSSKDRDGA